MRPGSSPMSIGNPQTPRVIGSVAIRSCGSAPQRPMSKAGNPKTHKSSTCIACRATLLPQPSSESYPHNATGEIVGFRGELRWVGIAIRLIEHGGLAPCRVGELPGKMQPLVRKRRLRIQETQRPVHPVKPVHRCAVRGVATGHCARRETSLSTTHFLRPYRIVRHDRSPTKRP